MEGSCGVKYKATCSYETQNKWAKHYHNSRLTGCNRAAVASMHPRVSVMLSISLICGTVPSVRRDLVDVLFDGNEGRNHRSYTVWISWVQDKAFLQVYPC